jgi:hypothetical protein
MNRTEADLAHTISATADVVVDTDAFVTAVKRHARQRRRKQLALAGLGTAAVTIAVVVPVSLIATGHAPTGPAASGTPAPRVFGGTCVVEPIATPLGVDPGQPIRLIAMDPTGRFIVGSYGPSVPPGETWTGGSVPVLWDNGVGRVLPVTGEDIRDVFAVDVNRHGSVVGGLRRLVDGMEVPVSWVYLQGRGWSELPPPEGFGVAYAVGINGHNEVVGYTAPGYLVVWSLGPDDRWTSRTAYPAAGNSGWPIGITDDGVVVGNVSARPYVMRPDGSNNTLPLPDDTTWGAVAEARGDWAVGAAGGANTRISTHVVRWNLRTGEMSTVDKANALFFVVNARGDVAFRVSREQFVAGLPEAWSVLVTHDGLEYELPDPPANPTGDPVAISDDATLVAAYDGHLWRC